MPSSNQDKGPTILAVACTVTSLATIFCAARVYTRSHILGRLHLDDCIIIVSILFGWCATGINIVAVHYGFGKHFATLTTQQQSRTLLWDMVAFCPSVMSFAVPKFAVVSLLTRLLNPRRQHRIFLWCLPTVTLLAVLACIGVLFGQCAPTRALWDFSVTDKKCISAYVLVDLAIFAGVMSAVTDLYLAIYPAVVLYKLHLKTRKKVALIVALGIGSIASIVAIYKTTRLPSLASADFTYDTADLVMWTCIEGSTIIIASCIPTLQPLADRVIGSSFFGSSGDNRHGYYYKNYGTSRSRHNNNNTASGVGAGSRSRTRDGNIELQSSSGVLHHTARHKPRDPNGLTFLDKEGSEESILRQAEADKTSKIDRADKASSSTFAPSTDGISTLGGGLDPSQDRDPDHCIVRTDVITVSYAQQSGQQTSSMDDVHRWKRGL